MNTTTTGIETSAGSKLRGGSPRPEEFIELPPPPPPPPFAVCSVGTFAVGVVLTVVAVVLPEMRVLHGVSGVVLIALSVLQIGLALPGYYRGQHRSAAAKSA